MIKSCPKCNIDFDDYSKWGPKKFCSRKCANSKIQTAEANAKRSQKLSGRTLSEEHKKNLSGPNHRKWKGGGILPKNCLHCDKEFLTRNSTQKFCSTLCWKDNNKIIMGEWHRYRLDCAFKFNVYDYPNYYDLSLIEKFRWYKAANRGNNPGGVSRDHMYSILDGFRNNISPAIISHPANCCLLLQNDNSSKKSQSSISMEELLKRIQDFDLLAK